MQASAFDSHFIDDALNEHTPLRATPYQWRDPATIPRRKWVYGRHYIRRFVSATVAPGGLAKSSLLLVEACAIALGRPLLGIEPNECCRVWYWNGEDPREELDRRLAAIAQHHGFDGRELEKNLFIDSGRVNPIKLAKASRGEIAFDARLIADITATIHEEKIGVFALDPLISTHDVPESYNMSIDAVVKKLGHIADETNAAIELAHHVRKTNGNETTVEDARGASAIINAVRSARVLNRMTNSQAQELKVEKPQFYFRADTGKANLAPPAEARWHHLANVELPNEDHVGVVEAWSYPSALDQITPDHMYRVRRMAAEGEWRKDARSEDWIGRAVADVVGLDLEDPADRRTVRATLAAWFANGVLTTATRRDSQRKERTFVVPGDWNEGGE